MSIDKLSPIDKTTLPEEAQFYQPSKKHVIIKFDKYLGEYSDNLNTFTMIGSHRNVIKKICDYANWFIYFYDEDMDIMHSLVRIKYQIQKQKLVYTESAFLGDIEDIFTYGLVKRIFQMVDDQYIVDLEEDLDDYDDSYISKYTNEHGKLILAIMIAINLTSPAANHYAKYAEIENNKSFMTKYVSRIVTIFEKFDALLNDKEPINFINKLCMTVDMKINESRVHKKMWERQSNQSQSVPIYMVKLIRITLADLLHKVQFSGNFVSFVTVSLEDNINRYIIGRSPFDSYIMDIEKTQGELSTLELLDMNNTCVDENQIIISEIEIKEIDNMLANRMIFITKDRFEFMMENLKPCKEQIQLVSWFISSKLNHYNSNFNQEYYLKAALVMAHDLRLQKYNILPDIILANSKASVKRRVSSKIISKIYESSYYKVLETRYQDYFGDDLKEDDKKNNPIIKIFLELNGWIFEKVTPNDEDREEINDNISSIILSHELLRFYLSL